MELLRPCVNCGSTETAKRTPLKTHQIYCSIKCRTIYYTSKSGRTTSDISTSSTGTLSELLASADLISKGYYMFRALSPSSPCDLIALRGDKCLRVEVTTGRRNSNTQSIYYPNKTKDQAKFDLLVVVVPEEGTVTYYPSLD